MRTPLVVAVYCSAILGAADTLPARCGAIGAKNYTPPPFTIPAVDLNRGTVITVSNATVAINGDTSSVAALVANPGPDGISIQEAIMATNNDPGAWNIQFAPALKGSTIVADSGPLGGLAFLAGGNVTINGDIDGDGQPDITLTSKSGANAGIYVTSGGNTLYALALQNFTYGVWIGPQSTGTGLPTPLSNTTISNLTISGVQYFGIGFNPPSPFSAGVPAQTWDHLLIVGNTISGSVSGPVIGIDLELGSTAGDTLKNTTIANNNIVLPMPGAGGIAMNFGAGLGSTNNQALDTLVANNIISATYPQFAIRIATGVGSASGNLIDGMQVIANQIRMSGPAPMTGPDQSSGIIVVSGDAASDDLQPPVLPIQYSEHNIARNISILSNTFEGALGFGIDAQVACCGNAGNTIDNFSILGNTLTGGVSYGMLLGTGASGGFYSRPTTANVLSSVRLELNTIQMAPTIYIGCNCYPAELGITFGGIQIWAGLQDPGNSVIGISIANNEVDTPLVGVAIFAGLGGQGTPNAPVFPADNNVVSDLQISCNQVDQIPTLGLDYPGIKGITVTAGLLNATGNQVQQVHVEDNLIGGVLSDAAFFANLGDGASGNTISTTGAASRRRP
jgi:hypothetical protein